MPNLFTVEFFCYTCEALNRLVLPVYGNVNDVFVKPHEIVFPCKTCKQLNAMMISSGRPVVKGYPPHADSPNPVK